MGETVKRNTKQKSAVRHALSEAVGFVSAQQLHLVLKTTGRVWVWLPFIGRSTIWSPPGKRILYSRPTGSCCIGTAERATTTT